MRRTTIVLLVGLCSLLAAPVWADQPRRNVAWSNAVVGRLNPLGLVNAAEAQYQLRLYPSDSAVLETNYLGLGFAPKLTPAYGRFGPKIEIMPMSILGLGVEFEFIQYFKAFDFLQSFEEPTANVSDEALEANGEDDQHYAASGTQITFFGLLQAKVGPIAVRTKAAVFRSEYMLRNNHPVFYDPFLDVMLPASGWAWTNDLDGLYVGEKLIAGLRFSSVMSYLPDIEAEDDPNSPIHRLGPLILYEVYGGESGLESVQVLGLFQWYLSHRYRTGQETSQALPYTGVGVLMKGRLL